MDTKYQKKTGKGSEKRYQEPSLLMRIAQNSTHNSPIWKNGQRKVVYQKKKDAGMAA